MKSHQENSSSRGSERERVGNRQWWILMFVPFKAFFLSPYQNECSALCENLKNPKDFLPLSFDRLLASLHAKAIDCALQRESNSQQEATRKGNKMTKQTRLEVVVCLYASLSLSLIPYDHEWVKFPSFVCSYASRTTMSWENASKSKLINILNHFHSLVVRLEGKK